MAEVIVIGGGAAGMMAAVAAAEAGHRVTILERNEKLGKKVFITGKGRCNLTNACDTEGLFRNVIHNPKFLYSAFYTYDSTRIMEFMEENGCPVKVERGERVFPVSDHSSDVIRAFQNKLRELGVKICLNTDVSGVLTDRDEMSTKDPSLRPEEAELPKIRGVLLADGKKIYADHVILATGGLSYPVTGSNGDGQKMAGKLGHTITDTRPSLVPLCIAEEWCRQLQGLSLKNVELSMVQGKKKLYSGFGEMLFTHFGVSGPLVLTASCYLDRIKGQEPVLLHLNLKPALTAEQLDKRLLREFEEHSKKQFANALGGLFPAKLIPIMVELSKIPAEKRVYEITREERQAFAGLIQDLTMTVVGTRGYQEAIITQGGVAVKEVDPSTMQSKKIKGLSFAGEVLDLDAVTGGFNLQIAWSTGYLAGSSIPAE